MKIHGKGEAAGSLFVYVDLEERNQTRHPLRLMRRIFNDLLAVLDAQFGALHNESGCPSIAPERLIRTGLLPTLFSIRSERQLMEQMDYSLLFPWFVGLGTEGAVWDEGRTGSDPLDQFRLERAKPRAEGQRCSARTAIGY